MINSSPTLTTGVPFWYTIIHKSISGVCLNLKLPLKNTLNKLHPQWKSRTWFWGSRPLLFQNKRKSFWQKKMSGQALYMHVSSSTQKLFFFCLLLPYPQWTFLGAASRAYHPDASWSLCRPEHTERWKKEGKERHERKKARRPRQGGWIAITQTGSGPNSNSFTADASLKLHNVLKVTKVWGVKQWKQMISSNTLIILATLFTLSLSHKHPYGCCEV